MVIQKRTHIIKKISNLIEHIYTKYNASYDMINIEFGTKHYVRIPRATFANSQYESYKTHIKILNATINSIINDTIVDFELVEKSESVSCYYDSEYNFEDLYGKGGITQAAVDFSGISSPGDSTADLKLRSYSGGIDISTTSDSITKLGFQIVTNPNVPKNLCITYGS